MITKGIITSTIIFFIMIVDCGCEEEHIANTSNTANAKGNVFCTKTHIPVKFVYAGARSSSLRDVLPTTGLEVNN